MKAKQQKGLRVKEESSQYARWEHPGGKLRELGPKTLSNEEILAILISTGHKGKSAEKVADELLTRFGTLEELSNLPLSKLIEIKGLGDVKVIRIAAAFELARRIVREKLEKYGSKEK
jgi:DNA repair protein RadC